MINKENTIKSFFNEEVKQFKNKLNEIDFAQSNLNEYSETLQMDLDSSIFSMIDKCRDFENNSALSEDELKEVKEKFREEISPWYEQSILTSRGLHKPKGYPGDHVTLECIYNKKPLSQGIGKYLDVFFLNAPLAEAIRNRKDFVRDSLTEVINYSSRDVKILNIASGSCREWYELAQMNGISGIELTCLDFDQEALDFSSDRLKEIANGIKVKPYKDNVAKFVLRKHEKENLTYKDYVYSIGLYDYVPDKMLKKLVSKQYSLLDSGGEMLLAFKDCTKYDKTLYDWIADWKFEPRKKDNVDQFLHVMGFDPTQIKSSWEKSGIIFFYSINKES